MLDNYIRPVNGLSIHISLAYDIKLQKNYLKMFCLYIFIICILSF